MTTEEKLQHFRDTCMADAQSRADQMIEEYRIALQKNLEDHKADEQRRADTQVKIERERIEKEANRQLALEQIRLRMEIGKKSDELKEKIFVELNDKLANFMSGPDYEKLLDQQITEAIAFAGEDEMVIYMDPADQELIHAMSQKHGIGILPSKYGFHGGMRAVIPHKNILIDNSFERKLSEVREGFVLELGGNHG